MSFALDAYNWAEDLAKNTLPGDPHEDFKTGKDQTILAQSG